MFKKFCIFLTCLIIGPLSMAAPVSALEAGDIIITVNPAEQELALTPGKRKTGSITVYNNGRFDFDFEVDAKPYSTESETYEPSFATETPYTKLSSWITFPEKRFSIESGKAVEVKFNIDVPNDIPGSGQYAAIIVRIINKDDGNSSVEMSAQVASLLYGHVWGGELREAGEMVAHELPSFMLGSGFRMTAAFSNTGNIDYRVRQTLEVNDFFTGKTVIDANSETASGAPLGTMDWTILPDTTRVVSTIWSDAPQLGFFRVKQTLNFLDRTETFEKVVFLCPIWLLVLVSAFVLLLILWIISRIRSRRQDAPQVF